MTAAINERALEAEHRIVTVCCRWPDRLDHVTCELADFVSPRWRECLEAIQRLRADGRGIDELSVQEAVHGRAGLDDLVLIDGLPEMVGEYSRIVREEAQKRRLLSGGSEVITQLKADGDLEAALSAMSRVVAEATIGQPDEAMPVRKILEGRYLEIGEIAERLQKGDPAATGIPTGVEKLDEVLGGIQPGIVTLMAARPAMGKSTVALTITEHVTRAGIGVHVFSLEDTRDAYADRVLSHHSKIPTERIRACKFVAGDLGNLATATRRIASRTNWIVDDRSGITAEELVRCVRRNAAKNGTRLVIVDYISLLRGQRGQDVRTRVSEAINTLGDAAKQDRMAYLVLAQLNRDLEKRDDKRPILADLKESGSLEERSKAVIMIHREAKYRDCKCNPDRREMCVHDRQLDLFVRKNSNGVTGRVCVEWWPEEMKIK